MGTRVIDEEPVEGAPGRSLVRIRATWRRNAHVLFCCEGSTRMGKKHTNLRLPHVDNSAAFSMKTGLHGYGRRCKCDGSAIRDSQSTAV